MPNMVKITVFMLFITQVTRHLLQSHAKHPMNHKYNERQLWKEENIVDIWDRVKILV